MNPPSILLTSYEQLFQDNGQLFLEYGRFSVALPALVPGCARLRPAKPMVNPPPVTQFHRTLYEQTLIAYDESPPGKNLRRRISGGLLQHGYRSVCINRQHTLAHRICWAIHYGEWPQALIDHGPLSSNKDDNRIDNLRQADKAQNAHNSKTPHNNTSGHKGVVWFKPAKMWVARFMNRGKMINVGYFHDKDEAIATIALKRAEVHGVFARDK